MWNLATNPTAAASTIGPRATRPARGSEALCRRSRRGCSGPWSGPDSPDAGCWTSAAGRGDLALGTLASGAKRAVGIDLSPGGIEQPRALAAERGLSARAAFSVGDGAVVPLERHDVVALNRVLCCYPSVDLLLGNSLGAAGSLYAYTAPVDRGPVKLFNRVSVGISNAWFRLRVKKFRGFQAFVHDLDAVDRTFTQAGFRLVHRSSERVEWRLAVFARG